MAGFPLRSLVRPLIITITIRPLFLFLLPAKLGQLLVWEWQSETYVLKQQGHFHDMNSIAYSPDASILGEQHSTTSPSPSPLVR